MTATYGKEMMCAPRQQLEWGFGGRRKVRDGALLMALFLGGIGAGQFVVSTWLFDWWQSAVIGLIFVAVGKSAAHLIYLGRPSRFPRLFLKPLTSWISRGFIAMVVFCVFGAAYLAPYFSTFSWLPWSPDDGLGRAFWGVAMLAAFVVMIYDGFVLASCKSIASWHTMLLPVMFFVYAIAGGFAMTILTVQVAIGPFVAEGTSDLASMDLYLLAALVSLVILYVINLATSDTTAKESLRTLLLSRTAIIFVGLAILAGLLIPLALAVFHQAGMGATLANALLVASALLELGGDLSVRHSILRAGLHAPVF